MRQGRVVAERHVERDPEQDLPYIPLSMGSLKIDSDRAFVIAEVAARRAGIGFDSIHYQLRCRDLRNEPVWVLNLIDQEKAIVGALYVSAVTGETLRAVWHRPGTRDYSQVNEGPGLFTRLTDKIGNGIANLRGKNNNPQPAPNPAMAAPAR
ncbi:MAG: hypothetical protein H7A53_04100 [Akkermansiaceae bacterium]|nr:hypothetical protein [Akkermansiaceae bacterium]